MSRRAAALAVLASTLAACGDGPEERAEVASTRAVMRPDIGVPSGSEPVGAGAAAAALAAAPEASPALLERGRELYGAFCRGCHGADGAGRGPVVARGHPAPPSLFDPRFDAPETRLTPARTVAVVTHGAGLMRPMAEQVSPRDRWAIALYLDDWRARR